MKKFKFDKTKKSFILSILLLVAIVGTAATVALAVAQSNGVMNSFRAADHDTDIDEPEGGTPDEKEVAITNKAKDNAFVRARVTVSPEEAYNATAVTAENWEYNKEDGFFYYLKVVGPNGKTSNLLEGVTPDSNFKGDTFDVTIYEESCVATVSADKKLTLTDVEKAFDEALKNGTVEVK